MHVLSLYFPGPLIPSLFSLSVLDCMYYWLAGQSHNPLYCHTSVRLVCKILNNANSIIPFKPIQQY